jgi:hypothetical protein
MEIVVQWFPMAETPEQISTPHIEQVASLLICVPTSLIL